MTNRFPSQLRIGPARFTQGGTLTIACYPNGEVALFMHDEIDGERDIDGCPITVALEDAPHIGPRFVWLKGWSENQGIPEAMVRAGYVRMTGEEFPTGFVKAQKAELLEPLLSEVMKIFPDRE